MSKKQKLSDEVKEQLDDPKGMIGDNGIDTVVNRLVEETLVGMHGSGRERMITLGVHYEAVQKEINNRLRNK